MTNEEAKNIYSVLYDVMRKCQTEGIRLTSVRFETVRDSKTNTLLLKTSDLRLLSKLAREDIATYLQMGHICFREQLLAALRQNTEDNDF